LQEVQRRLSEAEEATQYLPFLAAAAAEDAIQYLQEFRRRLSEAEDAIQYLQDMMVCMMVEQQTRLDQLYQRAWWPEP